MIQMAASASPCCLSYPEKLLTWLFLLSEKELGWRFTSQGTVAGAPEPEPPPCHPRACLSLCPYASQESKVQHQSQAFLGSAHDLLVL